MIRLQSHLRLIVSSWVILDISKRGVGLFLLASQGPDLIEVLGVIFLLGLKLNKPHVHENASGTAVQKLVVAATDRKQAGDEI